MSFVFYRAIWAEKWGVNTRVSVFLFRCLASITEAGDSLVTLRSRDPGLEPAARERVISSRLESRQMTSLSCEAADRALTLCEDCLLGPDIARGHEAAPPARDRGYPEGQTLGVRPVKPSTRLATQLGRPAPGTLTITINENVTAGSQESRALNFKKKKCWCNKINGHILRFYFPRQNCCGQFVIVMILH